VQAGGEF